MIGELLDALIPPVAGLPGGSIAEPVLRAEHDLARVLDRFKGELEGGSGAGAEPAAAGPGLVWAAWTRLLAAEPRDSSALLHLLSAAYFADPRVRAHYRLEAFDRPELQRERLAALLATVPPAPQLPERR